MASKHGADCSNYTMILFEKMKSSPTHSQSTIFFLKIKIESAPVAASMEGSIIRVISHRAKPPTSAFSVVVDTTSHSGDWSRGLSPFYLGPIKLYGEESAQVFENAYQYCKLYPIHARDGEPGEEYYKWARAGWANATANRRPMGRTKPICAVYNGDLLGYVEARKRIYCTLYAEAVQKTDAWVELVKTYNDCRNTGKTLYLRDYDGYNCYKTRKGVDVCLQKYNQVLNNPDKIMGHAFVLAMMLDDRREWL